MPPSVAHNLEWAQCIWFLLYIWHSVFQYTHKWVRVKHHVIVALIMRDESQQRNGRKAAR